MKPPLTQTQLRLIEHYSNTRFNGEFWGCVNVRRVIRALLGQIKYLEGNKKMNIEHRTSNVQHRIKNKKPGIWNGGNCESA